MAAPEVNFSTYPTKMLSLMGYPNLYVREVEDDYTGRIKNAFGFQTNKLTRPVIIAELIRVMREGLHLIRDEETLLEMLTFTRNDKLRAEAESGAHDDCIMALALAYYVRPQQRMTVLVDKAEGTARWSEDMWEDYHRASPEGREMLLKLWGEPR